MKSAAPVLFLLICSGIASALFLAAQGEEGRLLVLCEGQREAFISSPDGALMRLQLNSSSQAEFAPSLHGPHAVQCGNETKVVQAQLPSGAPGMPPGNGITWFVIASLAAFFALMLAAFALLARHFISQRVEFTKRVSGGTAELSLCSGMELTGIEISDPVEMGHGGKAVSFRLQRLSAGQKWAHACTVANPSRALPASLFAHSKNGKVSLLSRLFIEGKQPQSQKSSLQGKGKPHARRLPKAA